MVDNDSSVRYSSIVRLQPGTTGLRVYPSHLRDRQLIVESGSPVHQLRIHNSQGLPVYAREGGMAVGVSRVQLPLLPAGTYLVTVWTGGLRYTQKIIIE
jgi:hypothetical protein